MKRTFSSRAAWYGVLGILVVGYFFFVSVSSETLKKSQSVYSSQCFDGTTSVAHSHQNLSDRALKQLKEAQTTCEELLH